MKVGKRERERKKIALHPEAPCPADGSRARWWDIPGPPQGGVIDGAIERRLCHQMPLLSSPSHSLGPLRVHPAEFSPPPAQTPGQILGEDGEAPGEQGWALWAPGSTYYSRALIGFLAQRPRGATNPRAGAGSSWAAPPGLGLPGAAAVLGML